MDPDGGTEALGPETANGVEETRGSASYPFDHVNDYHGYSRTGIVALRRHRDHRAGSVLGLGVGARTGHRQRARGRWLVGGCHGDRPRRQPPGGVGLACEVVRIERQRGVTLVELVVVIALMGVLAAVGVQLMVGPARSFVQGADRSVLWAWPSALCGGWARRS
jgi:prepilin-type N-terminal cleavage/methylation domain-containing protein